VGLARAIQRKVFAEEGATQIGERERARETGKVRLRLK